MNAALFPFYLGPFLFRALFILGEAANYLLETEATMAVPKSKISNSRRGMRRAHDKLSNPTYVEDKDSGELRRPHHIDLKSGMYRGRQVLQAKD